MNNNTGNFNYNDGKYDVNSRALLTKIVISDTLYKAAVKSTQRRGLLCYFLAYFFIFMGVAGFVGGIFIVGFLFVFAGIWLVYRGIKNTKLSKRNRDALMHNQFRIVETDCIDIEITKITDTDSVGEYDYRYNFRNGVTHLETDKRVCEVGDVFYMVYMPESKVPDAKFNGREFIPADDLVIEKCV